MPNSFAYSANTPASGAVSAAKYVDPITGELKDLLAGGPGTRVEGLPQLIQANDANQRQRLQQEAATQWDARNKRFMRPPNSDAEATAMSSFMEQQNADGQRVNDEKKSSLLRILLGQMGGH